MGHVFETQPFLHATHESFYLTQRNPSSTLGSLTRNSSGDEIANVTFYEDIVLVEASAYAH